MIYASSTSDEYDADLSFGDVSLREAANHANTAGVPTAIKEGTYDGRLSDVLDCMRRSFRSERFYLARHGDYQLAA
jgi:hypothetical protein